MPHFSATAVTDAAASWTVEVDGRTYTARPVSRLALLAFYDGLERAKGNAAREEAALRRLLRIAFPARWRYVLQPSRDPVEAIMGLGVGAAPGEKSPREQALDSFFAALLPHRAAGPSRTNGPSGSGPSSAAPRPSPAGDNPLP